MVMREREAASTMMSNSVFSAQSLHCVYCKHVLSKLSAALHCGASHLDNVGEVVAASSHCLQGLVQECKVHCAEVQQTQANTAAEDNEERFSLLAHLIMASNSVRTS
jgi:hypothetical protein